MFHFILKPAFDDCFLFFQYITILQETGASAFDSDRLFV